MHIFPIAYCPPISWFSAALQYDCIELEVSQYFRKQQYTNRMWIKGANGDLKLSIPVGRKGAQVPIKDKKISYQANWQLQHYRSWEAAYRNSPYYEYYIDSFQALFQKRPVFLIDYLEQAFFICQQKLGISWDIKMSEQFSPIQQAEETDWRTAFDPTRQKQSIDFQPITYPQVFDGFSADLSIVDLLFNEGPASLSILQKCLTSSVS